MKKIVVGAVFAAGVGLAGFAGAGVASAAPGMNFDCSPCVSATAEDPGPLTGAPWTAFFSADPWGKFFDATNGTVGDSKGAWESGVEAVNGGAWEKVFGEAP